MKSYLKFTLMMATSFVIMYAVMFLNAASIDHVMLSTMRTYMTLLMIAPMAVVMLLYMWGMYKNKKLNALILAVSIVGFGAIYYMMRNQTGISDVQYMKAMIPHHSSAILTSENAHLQDPETKKLAEDIIKLQKEEIALMKEYLKRIKENNN
ncbi:DUF305 domain-containing protein [Planktosalinus lacus]|uniref:DUF305 domain-containing protein n=1 Tax=Planktosalinus lacus TaxID=1526573 RepID=A0A8J2V832_9FLAO|nr:DUF305 domain-containing protein [Planktosalinus lacus]GGD86093.1 hypothetical protein GCM10011312_07670 [Planktosalinus lacus]